MFKLKKNIDDLWPVNSKKVLVRVDYNVPIKNGVIGNDYRIRSTLPTLKTVLDQGGMVILMSHLGRPKGVSFSENQSDKGYDKEFSLKPVAHRLEELLVDVKVLFAEDCLDAQKYVDALKPGQVLLLENVRFYNNEGSKKESDRLAMAERLASYGDYFVSDAFGTAHRDSATMTGIPKVLGHGAAGYLMDLEIKYFTSVLDNPPRPMVAIVGGAKVSDKILLLEHMLTHIDKLVIGGAMAYTFLSAQGMSIGKSYHEDGQDELALHLLDTAKSRGIEVLLPVDHVCHTDFAYTDEPVVTDDANVPDGYMALDIGPKTIALFKECIIPCRAAIWNGPMGVFEISTYCKGTFSIAETLGDGTQQNGMITIIGGGDSASAAEKCNQSSRFTHVSTGGGASLELLEGKLLPGISALTDKK